GLGARGPAVPGIRFGAWRCFVARGLRQPAAGAISVDGSHPDGRLTGMSRLRHLVRQVIRRLLPEDHAIEGVRRIVAHPLARGIPRVSLASLPAVDRPDRALISQRLIKAYALSKAHEAAAGATTPQDDLCTGLLAAALKQLLHILHCADPCALSNYL